MAESTLENRGAGRQYSEQSEWLRECKRLADAAGPYAVWDPSILHQYFVQSWTPEDTGREFGWLA